MRVVSYIPDPLGTNLTMPTPEQIPTWRALSALALVSQLGLVVAAPIVGGVIAGKYLDTWLGGSGLILVGMILFGVASGVYGAYRILVKEITWKR